MSMTPFELRLELLKMSNEMFTEAFYFKKEQMLNQWNIQVEEDRKHGRELTSYPEFPAYPSEDEIIARAEKLYCFFIEKK